jgi:hypothetical protein
MRSLIKALVRLRLAEGWEAWVAPGGQTLWARIRLPGQDLPWHPETRGQVLQTIVPMPSELDVLDEVLREKVS